MQFFKLFIMFLIIFSLIIFSAIFYIKIRLIDLLPFSKTIKLFLLILITFFIYTIPLHIIINKAGLGSKYSDILTLYGFISISFLILLFVVLLSKDIFLSFFLIAKKFIALTYYKKKSIELIVDPDRRQFILNSINSGVFSIAGLLSIYSYFNAKSPPQVKKVIIPIKYISKDIENLSIVQISDIHISATIKKNFVQMIVDKVNSLKPDIIVFTGDIADGPVSRLKNDAAPLNDLQAKYGKFFVTGNHEYYSGALQWIRFLENSGFTVLTNENRIIKHEQSKILIGGVPDFRASHFIKDHKPDPFKAISNAEDSDIKILLAHQPKSIYDAQKAGFDIQLSGHTHGGQLWLFGYIVLLDQPFIKGLHKYKNTQIYVSQGTGYWGPPLRLGTCSEITLINFKNILKDQNGIS